jgi:hypothetical protein
MTAVKIAISLPPETLALAKAAVRRGAATSVSAFAADAIAAHARELRLRDVLDEILEESGGPPTALERARARRSLAAVGVTPRKRG